MVYKAPFRRFSRRFKQSLCAAMRAGNIGRREAQRAHRLSGNLIHHWLNQFDRGLFDLAEKPAARVAEEYELRIAELERKIGQLTMEADLLKKTQKLDRANSDDDFFVVSGPRPVPPKGLPGDRACAQYILLPLDCSGPEVGRHPVSDLDRRYTG